MKVELKLDYIDNLLPNKKWPYLIAGPCSAESEAQMLSTAIELKKIGKVSAFRAGIWKPRTRPGAFEGAGEEGLKWMKTVKEQTGFRTSTEVANPEHVQLCLKYGVDVLWIGARTSASPFTMQDIADSLKGVKDVTVLVKNPVNPDVQLWIGAFERLNRAGITKLGAIHRGFSPFEKTVFRNIPMWQIPIELKRICPELLIICDPSHIAGNRELIPFVAQKALDLDFHGLMIESHIQPDVALSDAQQQLTPKALAELILGLELRETVSKSPEFKSHLDVLRSQIDEIDEEIVQKLSSRMKIASKIGEFKRDNNVTILQVSRWEEILNNRKSLGVALGLHEDFVEKLLKLIHDESISIQEEIMTKKSNS